MGDKEYHVANFATFVSKTVLFPPPQKKKKWMNLISNQFSAASIKWMYKVVIELRLVQFWSEIILMISNRTRAARSFNFEITHMISAQTVLHSVQ